VRLPITVERGAGLPGQRDNELDIALNRLTRNVGGAPRFGEEFAGSTFSRDGKTLYVNIQASAGISFAIWANWQKLGV
jgi:hypothetical protein